MLHQHQKNLPLPLVSPSYYCCCRCSPSHVADLAQAFPPSHIVLVEIGIIRCDRDGRLGSPNVQKYRRKESLHSQYHPCILMSLIKRKRSSSYCDCADGDYIIALVVLRILAKIERIVSQLCATQAVVSMPFVCINTHEVFSTYWRAF